MRRNWDNLSVPMMMTLEFVVQVYTKYFAFMLCLNALLQMFTCTCGVNINCGQVCEKFIYVSQGPIA